MTKKYIRDVYCNFLRQNKKRKREGMEEVNNLIKAAQIII